MSLLLDALKKAAEKNAKTEPIISNDSAKNAFTKSAVTSVEESSAQNVTEMELAQIINASKNKSRNLEESLELSLEEAKLEAETNEDAGSLFDELAIDELAIDELAIDELTIDNKASLDKDALFIDDLDSDISLALLDEDPSIKFFQSDEEILLTDDDVTEFLGSEDLQTRLTQQGDSTIASTRLKPVIDRVDESELNLLDSSKEFSLIKNDSTNRPNQASATSNMGAATHLNDLTNDVTISAQDQTSTETFASDNYDRTLVKIDSDVSKVFTGMKSAKMGVIMTPDFAKKVFIHKSTTLKYQNYKIYTLISLVLFLVIGVFALFEMQSKIEMIDTSLVRLKQNPVPSDLRFKREENKNDELSVLQGRIDIEALNLLKSLTKKNKDTNEKANEKAVVHDVEQQDIQIIKIASINTIKVEPIQPLISDDVAEKTLSQIKKPSFVSKKKPVVAQSAKNLGQLNNASQKKSGIKIEMKNIISKESIWLNDAYSAFEQGNIELASMNYARVLAKDPVNRDALLGQAAIFMSQNKTSQAIDNYQAVLLVNPKDSLAITSLIAVSTLSPIDSESRLKLLYRESPNAPYLQFALGNVVSVQNRWQEAQNFYFMAYQTEPENPDYAYNLAVSLEHINQVDIAINYYKQAIKNAQVMQASFNVALTQQRIEALKP